tara:strand:- start:20 stop:346 length:327 start_codon:yes stop_codon:yes gene_type:complete
MFGMLRNLARPISFLGQKLGRLFSLGRKVAPAGVIIEKVIESGKPIGSFMNIANKAGRGADVMNSAGGFVSAGTQAANNMANLSRYARPITNLDYMTRTGADVMRGFN